MTSPLSIGFSEYERPLRQIQWFTGMVLLVISANLAGLLLSRSASRRREFGVRASLGASWGVLLRQLLVEHAVLAAIAVPIGCAVAVWLSQVAVAFFGQSASVATDGNLVVDLRPGGTLVAVAAMAGFASILVAGAIPSLLATLRASTPGVRLDLLFDRLRGPRADANSGRTIVGPRYACDVRSPQHVSDCFQPGRDAGRKAS